MEVLGLLVTTLIFGLIGGFIAHKKKRSKVIWFLLSAIFIFPIIIVLFLPKVSTGDSHGDDDLSTETKPLPIRKIIMGVVIVAFAVIYTFFLEGKKDETALRAKNELIVACNSDSDCLEKIEKNFDRCIETNLAIEKTGRKSREVVLDYENLKMCIGL